MSSGRQEIVARLPAGERFAPGTLIYLAYEAEALHLFGPDGRRCAPATLTLGAAAGRSV